MEIGKIIQGHTAELLGLNKDLLQERLKICKKCSLFLNTLGGICNPKLYLDPKTEDVSTTYKNGYKKGCGCRINAKARLVNEHCPNDKW